MPTTTDEFVILGITPDGTQFRPSDWAERLCGVMSQFGADHRMRYSPYVHPITSNGMRAVVVDARLRDIEPLAYNFLMSFAKDNDLRVRPGRAVLREAAGTTAATTTTNTTTATKPAAVPSPSRDA
jgi:Protein of unknown function (DUF3579)